MNSKNDKIQYIRDVFSYSKRFKGKKFVIYINDSMLSLDAFDGLIKDMIHILNAGIKLILISDASKSINTILARNSISTTIVGGRRIVKEEDIPLIQMASFDVGNRLITKLAGYQQTAVIGNWLVARSYGVVDGIDYCKSGVLEKINEGCVEKLLEDKIIPIFSVIGWSYTGTPYLLNSIELAVGIGKLLSAEKLFYILPENEVSQLEEFSIVDETTDNQSVETVYREEKLKVCRMNVAGARCFLEKNSAMCDTKMYRIIHNGIEALTSSLSRVHILNGNEEGVLLGEIFFTEGCGVMLYSDEYESIESMQIKDVQDVLVLLKPFIEEGSLIKRDVGMLLEQYKDYVVSKKDGTINGTAALHNLGEENAEIASLAVSAVADKKGIGRKLIMFLLKRAKRMNFKKVFVFTLKTGDWFERLGFVQIDSKKLPQLRLEEYLKQNRKSRIYEICLI